MDKNSKVQAPSFFQLGQVVLFLGMAILAGFALKEYKGESHIYILFTIASYGLIYFGFRTKAIFFDTFIAVFLWLGFWLKVTVRVAFFDGDFSVSTGYFGDTGREFDQVLMISTCAFLGILVASWLREKYLFVYPAQMRGISQPGLYRFYKEYRKFILTAFILLFVTVAVTNAYFGIYQRGEITKTILPFGLNGIYKWLLLFGFASFSAILLRLEYSSTKKTSYLIAIISLAESFVSNVSLFSRGMVLNTSALVYGVVKSLKYYEIKTNLRFLIICFIIFIVLFGSSIFVVNYMRASSALAVNEEGEEGSEVLLSTVHNDSKALLIDRWVGIEGVMSVSSFPGKSWALWNDAWRETYSDNATSFYDVNLIDSPYKNTNKMKHHYVSLPGIVAFCFYPGSYLFLFICMIVLGLGAAVIEFFVFKLGGHNIILCALLAQVIAFRFTSFGYVPSQSYLLFGAIILSVLMIYVFDRLLVFWYKYKDTNPSG